MAWDELLALELGACRGRGVVGLEPLLDGAALVYMAIYLFRVRDGEGESKRWGSAGWVAYARRAAGLSGAEIGAPC